MQLVERTIEVLELLSKDVNGLRLTEISKILNLPSSSTHRLLNSLKKYHFVTQIKETKKYTLGYKAISIGDNFIKEDSLIKSSYPIMEKLSKKVNKTVALSKLDGSYISTIDYVESNHFMQLLVRKDIKVPALITSAGKLLLSYSSEDVVKDVYAENKKSNFSLKPIDYYIDQLNITRDRGYSLIDEELQKGVFGIAAPVYDFNNKLIAALSITSIKEEDTVPKELINNLINSANEISIELGFEKEK